MAQHIRGRFAVQKGVRSRSVGMVGWVGALAGVLSACEPTDVGLRESASPMVVTCASLMPADPVIERVEPGTGDALIVFPVGAEDSPVAVLRVARAGLEGPTVFTIRELGGDTLGVDVTATSSESQALSRFEPALSLALFFQPDCAPADNTASYHIYRIERGGLIPQTGRYDQERSGRIEAELDHLTGFLIAQG